MFAIQKNIHIIIVSVMTLCFTLVIDGCKKPPAPVPQRKPDITELNVGGIKVLLKKNTKDIVSARLLILGGVSNYPKEQEGIEALTLESMVQGGTATENSQMLMASLSKIGAQITSEPDYDFSSVSLKTIHSKWDLGWEKFTQVITTPLFDEREFMRIKDQMISASKMKDSDPDLHLQRLTMVNSFEGKNYSKNVFGTEQSLQTLTLDQVKQYFQTIIVKNRIKLIVTGKVSEEDITKKVLAMLGGLALGTGPAPKDTIKYVIPSSYKAEERSMTNNYIMASTNGPKSGTKDALAMKLAMSIFQDRIIEEIRVKKNLSLTLKTDYMDMMYPFSVLYLNTSNTNEAVKALTDEITRAKTGGFTEMEVKNKKEGFLTNYFLNIETNSSLSLLIGKTSVTGNVDKLETILQDIKGISVEQINRVFRENVKNLNWSYLGNTSGLDQMVFKQIVE